MDTYKDFAYVYDRLMTQDVDYDKWCDYLENLFAKHGCEPDSICELACGTGNITSRLESRGYDITGVDISHDMLTIAAEKLRRIKLVRADMAKFQPETEYDTVLCMIDGVNYVISPKSLYKTFKNVRAMLKQDGVFIFDVSTQYKLRNILGNETFIHSEYDVFYSWQNHYIERYNMSDMLLNFFVRENDDSYRRFEERHLQRGYTQSELTQLLNRAGFINVSVYAELTFDAPCDDSERIVFVCS